MQPYRRRQRRLPPPDTVCDYLRSTPSTASDDRLLASAGNTWARLLLIPFVRRFVWWLVLSSAFSHSSSLVNACWRASQVGLCSPRAWPECTSRAWRTRATPPPTPTAAPHLGQFCIASRMLFRCLPPLWLSPSLQPVELTPFRSHPFRILEPRCACDRRACRLEGCGWASAGPRPKAFSCQAWWCQASVGVSVTAHASVLGSLLVRTGAARSVPTSIHMHILRKALAVWLLPLCSASGAVRLSVVGGGGPAAWAARQPRRRLRQSIEWPNDLGMAQLGHARCARAMAPLGARTR